MLISDFSIGNGDAKGLEERLKDFDISEETSHHFGAFSSNNRDCIGGLDIVEEYFGSSLEYGDFEE